MPADVALRMPVRPEVTFGAGAALSLPALVRGLGHQRAFVVTDQGLVAAGVAPGVLDGLGAAGLQTGVFDGVGRNPDLAAVVEGSLALRAFGPCAIVALGGGSPIDAAKAIALHAANDRPVAELGLAAGDLEPAGPILAVPTTAGTGTETNGFGVIDDPGAHVKRYVGHASTVPRCAVLDPVLTLSAPPEVTAACGIDVLAHAVESLQARVANAYSAALALEAAAVVVRRLPGVVADGRDLDGRAALLLASHLAGLAFAATGLGLAHAIGHALSARYGTAHGVALAAVLAQVVQLNLAERPAETARLAAVAGIAGGPAEVPAAVATLRDAVGLPGGLRRLGVPHADLPAVGADARADVVIANAPRVPSAPELVDLLRAAF